MASRCLPFCTSGQALAFSWEHWPLSSHQSNVRWHTCLRHNCKAILLLNGIIRRHLLIDRGMVWEQFVPHFYHGHACPWRKSHTLIVKKFERHVRIAHSIPRSHGGIQLLQDSCSVEYFRVMINWDQRMLGKHSSINLNHHLILLQLD